MAYTTILGLLLMVVVCVYGQGAESGFGFYGRPRECYLPSVTGPCRAAFRRWYYNRFSRRCEQFIYGGCQGNANNYMTEEECRRRCDSQSNVSVCRQPQVTGPCRAYIPRYWYNYWTRRCERFIYGGCQGNGNNFQTIGECYRRCRGRWN